MEGEGVAVTANLPSESGMNNKGLQVHETKKEPQCRKTPFSPLPYAPPPPPPSQRCIVSANCRLRSRAATSEEPKHTAPNQNVLCPMQMLTPRPAFLHCSKSNLIVFHLQVYQQNITNINVANVHQKFHGVFIHI